MQDRVDNRARALHRGPGAKAGNPCPDPSVGCKGDIFQLV